MADKGVVYIIVLNYNNFKCSDFCLESLRLVKSPSIKIVLVDNNSSDDSFEKLLISYPECIGIKSSENGGFARGTNLGLRYAYKEGGNYFLLLNNDVEVTSDFLTYMIEGFSHQTKVGAVTPKIYYRGNRNLIWHAGGHINMKRISGIARGYDEMDEGQYNEIIETNWASGACCLITRETLEKVGYLDEHYFFGQEEWDFSSSICRAGYKIIYQPKAVVYHEIAQSSKKSPSLYAYQMTYNKIYYANKYLSPAHFYFFLMAYMLYLWIYFPPRRLHDPSNSSDFYLMTAKRAAFWGIRDFFRKIFITTSQLTRIDQLLHQKFMPHHR